MRIALYQPDIPQNVGSILRLCACFGVPLHIIEPCGFPWDMRKIRQAAMDYLEQAQLIRHASWQVFYEQMRPSGRLVLLTTKASIPYHHFRFQPSDILLFGRESAGVPEEVHAVAAARIAIPLRPETRSFNVAMSAAMALAEGLRQTSLFPERT